MIKAYTPPILLLQRHFMVLIRYPLSQGNLQKCCVSEQRSALPEDNHTRKVHAVGLCTQYNRDAWCAQYQDR